MAWTEITRRKYRRDGPRYTSPLTDAEWALIAPLPPPDSHNQYPPQTAMPAARETTSRGRAKKLPMRSKFCPRIRSWLFGDFTNGAANAH
jgi:hypothetical protein